MHPHLDPRPTQKFSFGYELITWDLGGESLDDALGFLAGLGFRWFETLVRDTLGTDFSRRTMTLGPVGATDVVRDVDMFRRLALFARAQTTHGIRVASLFADAEWVNPNLWPDERDMLQSIARFLHSCGAPVLVCGGGPPQRGQDRSVSAYRAFAERLAEIGQYTQDVGIRLVYHPHLDCFVETREQLDRLMDVLDTRVVGLCIDPAHLQINGSDPVDIVRTYASTIGYMHLKDCKGNVQALTGYDRYLAFCELGAGIIDIKGLVDVLLQHGYDGIITVEIDYSQQGSEASCRQSVRYIEQELGLRLNP